MSTFITHSDPVTQPRDTRLPRRSAAEATLVSEEMASALVDLAQAMATDVIFSPRYGLWLNGAYDSSRRAHHAVASFHYTGRAVDLALYDSDTDAKVRDEALLAHLAALFADVLASQDHAWTLLYERAWIVPYAAPRDHIHASIASPSVAACLTCGNGRVDSNEECDDGNRVDGDGCSFGCQTESTCGNGRIESGEACDDHNTTPGDGCSATCTWEARCGDLHLDPGEVCDDGNNIGLDGCSADCTSTTG